MLVHRPGMVRGPQGRAGGGEVGVRGGEDWEEGVGSDEVEDLEGLGVELLLAEGGDVVVGRSLVFEDSGARPQGGGCHAPAAAAVGEGCVFLSTSGGRLRRRR